MSSPHEDGSNELEGNPYIEEEEEDVAVARNSSPPDGGWGWWVVFASFLCNMIVDGVCFSFGVISAKYRTVFNTSHAEVGWVGSTLAGCYLLVGPFVSALCERYGCRKVTVFGSIVTMTGFLLSTQSSSIGMLIFSYGVIGGIGFGMIYLPSIVCVGYWFERRRAFTTGIAVCGTGMGQLVFPPLAHYLLTEYGWEGKNVIMAGIVLHCAVCGMVFLPLDKQLFKRRKRVIRRCEEIERGAIMEALIADKKRQRTISNGSLDNCVITTDNQLIKVDVTSLEGKRNSSFIARFKRQLGFSVQSLACSKNSIQGIPSIVMDVVQKDLNKNSTPIYRPNGTKEMGDLSQSQLVAKRSSLADGNVPKSSSPVPNVHTPAANSSTKKNGIVITSSCDKTPGDDTLWVGQSLDEGITFKVQQISSNSSISRPDCDIESLSVSSASVNGSVISIQVIETSAPNTTNTASIRYRSSHSVTSVYPIQTSSRASSVTGSFCSVPQIRADSAHHEQDQDQKNLFWKCWQILCDMFDMKLMLNPIFALFLFSSFVTLLAFYVPFFYLPNKGELVGMTESSATFLLSIVGVTNTIGRLLCGWLADRPWMNTLHLNNFALILAGFAILLCPSCESEAPLAVLAAIFGLCVAVYVSLRSVLLVDLLGLEMLTKSFGVLMLFQGLAAFIGAPIAGELIDQTGNVNHCFYLAGGLTLLSGLLMLPILVIRKKDSSKDQSDLAPRDTPINETLRLEHLAQQI